MRTNPHALPTERIALPRRLVPRRPANAQPGVVIDVLAAFNAPPACRFEVGDNVRVQDAQGWHYWILILGIHPCGFVDACVYDGVPHYIGVTIEDLSALRTISVENEGVEAVDVYRRLLGLSSLYDEEVAA